MTLNLANAKFGLKIECIGICIFKELFEQKIAKIAKIERERMHPDYERANDMPIHKAKLMSYMKLMDAPIRLIINFHKWILKEGIKRMILKGADPWPSPLAGGQAGLRNILFLCDLCDLLFAKVRPKGVKFK